MDATFKSAPKHFYQIFNILVFIEEEKLCFPVVFALMASQLCLSYKKILQDIKLILNQNKIEWNYNKMGVAYDFEKSLLKEK